MLILLREVKKYQNGLFSNGNLFGICRVIQVSQPRVSLTLPLSQKW